MKFLYSGSESLFNGRMKLYPDGHGGERVAETLVSSRPIFNPRHFERYTREERPVRPVPGIPCEPKEKDPANVIRAKRRARKRVFDLAFCNEFDLFVTLTLNRERIDRYDYKADVRQLGRWLDNRVRRRGLRYVFLPEYHKDGAVHFHGLVNSGAVKCVDSGHRYKDGRVVYNLPEWSLGWTTAIPLRGDYAAVCAYICKYITKQPGNIGGRYYLSGGCLREPRFEYFNADYESMAGREITIDGANLGIKYCAPGGVPQSSYGGS